MDRILARLAEAPFPENPLFALPGGVTVEAVEEAVAGLDQKEEKSWTHALLVLGASLLLFTGIGLLNNPVMNLVILVAVLLVHEGGHYLGMRVFQYQNVQMYFIPLFGAAVSGKNEKVDGWKVAVVALLGPLPGLALGYLVGFAFLRRPDPWAGQLAYTLLLINGFNLLPFFPLDGGRFLNEVLFSRSRHLEVLFRILTGGLLALLGWSIGQWILIAAGSLVVLFSGHAFKISTLAQQARRRARALEEVTGSATEAVIPPQLLLDIRRAFPFVHSPKDYALQAKNVLEKLNARPPGLSATGALLGLYSFALATLLAAVLLYVHFTSTEYKVRMQAGEEALQAARYEEAEQHFRDATVTAQRFGQKDFRKGECLLYVAALCRLQGKHTEAEPNYRGALEVFEKTLAPSSPDLAMTLEGLAATLRDLKRPDEAAPLETRAREIRSASSPVKKTP